MLRALRGRRGLVALIGAWAGGGALISCEPRAVLGAGDDPFEVLADEPATDHPGGDGLVVGGGWFGLWGYQLGGRLERLPAPPSRPVPLPDHWLAHYPWVLRQDALARWWLESLLPPPATQRVLSDLSDQLTALPGAARDYEFEAFTMTPEPAKHAAAVARTVEHIVAGDLFQANLCARLEAGFDGDPLDVFCAGVTRLAPAYAAYVDTGDRVVASFSPELFLRRRGRTAVTSPIKGTRPLDVDPATLQGSAKDRAENVMIVDLMRNDLGRVCEPGSIQVPSLTRVERRAGVWHLISDVRGTLRDQFTDADLMRAAFPPGSVTGAPKVRAMELINELETTGREVYTGAIGYASPIAGLETCVVIRTLEFAGGRAWMGVGGGIVADSEPEAEVAECFAKAEPVLAAIGARLSHTPSRPPPPAPGRTDPAIPRIDGPRPDPAAGVFTTVLVRNGVPALADAHLHRLTASAAELGWTPDPDRLAGRLRDAVTHGTQRIRLTVRGDEVEVRAAPVSDRPEPDWQVTPVVVPGGLGAHKWADRRLLDRIAARHTGEPLLLDTDGTVLETARANVFVVDDAGVHTPPTDGRILPGVARQAVLEVLRHHRIPTHERTLVLNDLADAAEVFVTNAVRGVVPVTACTTVGDWAIGPTTRWLRSALAAWHEQPDPVPPQPWPRTAEHPRVLLIDNYDSFSHNLAQYAAELGATVEVIRNDAATVEELVTACTDGSYSHLILSPGPGYPGEAGISVSLVRRLDGGIPILGVCLGHQTIAEAYGGRVTRARVCVHGKPALVHHDGRGAFAGIPNPCAAARYHSLTVDRLPPDLVVTAHTVDGTVMGIRHLHHPVEGVQIHPESILTPYGHQMIANFLAAR